MVRVLRRRSAGSVLATDGRDDAIAGEKLVDIICAVHRVIVLRRNVGLDKLGSLADDGVTIVVADASQE